MSQEIYSIGPWIKKELTDEGRKVLKVKNRWLANFIHRYSSDPVTGERPFEVIDTSSKLTTESLIGTGDNTSRLITYSLIDAPLKDDPATAVAAKADNESKVIDIRSRMPISSEVELPIAVGQNRPIHATHTLINPVNADGPIRLKTPSAVEAHNKAQARKHQNGSTPSSPRSEQLVDENSSRVSGAAVGLAKNKRPEMHDTAFIAPELGNKRDRFLFGVIDGHGSSRIAEYIKTVLPSNITKALERKLSVVEALREAFAKTDEEVLKLRENTELVSRGIAEGAVAAVALVDKDKVTVANVGDAKVLLVSDGITSELTRDTLIADQREKDLIDKDRKYLADDDDVVTVDGISAPLRYSRSFGDAQAKHVITSQPAIVEYQIKPKDEYLILASDGLLEAFEDRDDIARLIRDRVGYITDEASAIAAAKVLKEHSEQYGESNFSAIVVGLEDGSPKPKYVSTSEKAVGVEPASRMTEPERRGSKRWLPLAAAGILGFTCALLAAGAECVVQKSSTTITPPSAPEIVPLSINQPQEVSFHGNNYRIDEIVFDSRDPLYASRYGEDMGSKLSSAYGLARAKLTQDRNFNFNSSVNNNTFDPWQKAPTEGFNYDKLYYPDGLDGVKYRENDRKVAALVEFMEQHNLSSKFEVKNGEVLVKHGEKIVIPQDLQRFFDDVQYNRMDNGRTTIDQKRIDLARLASVRAGQTS